MGSIIVVIKIACTVVGVLKAASKNNAYKLAAMKKSAIVSVHIKVKALPSSLNKNTLYRLRLGDLTKRVLMQQTCQTPQQIKKVMMGAQDLSRKKKEAL
nr:hypothetical protein [uncultured Campylobacter sp.]